MKYLCRDCGLPAPARSEKQPDGTWVITLLEHVDCRPWLLRFFNPDSQHSPPFTR